MGALPTVRSIYTTITLLNIVANESCGSKMISSAMPFKQLPTELVQEIANYSGPREVCALSRVCKKQKRITRNQWEKQRGKIIARQEMERIWERIRGHTGFNWIFGRWPIVNATAVQAIDHLIHDLDGRADLVFLATYPAGHIGHTPLVPIIMDARDLILKLHGYQDRHLCGGHPLCDPPHRFERFRCNISDSEMLLYDEYISLFLELSEMWKQIRKLNPRRISLSEAFEWQKMMEVIGAKIGYPFMAFYTARDLSHHCDPFRVLLDSVLPDWARMIKVDDYVERLEMFQNRTRVVFQ